MDDTSPEAMARKNLLDRLLNSVKQVQVYFGARQEIATESDARVSALCVEWEMVLAHAAKKQKPKNSLRLTGRSEGVSLWPLAKLCVSAEDLVRFSRLNHVTSELGRGRAWLRAAINERTLENYMHTVLAQEEQLRKLYEPSAFLLDQERSTMLPIMAAGLSSIIFAITTDASYLNTPARSVQLPTVSPPSPALQPPPPPDPAVCLPEACQLPPPATAGLGQPRDLSHDLPSYSSFPPPFTHTSQVPGAPPLLEQEADGDMIAVSTKVKKKKQKRSSKSKSGHMSSSSVPSHMSSPGEQEGSSGLSTRAEPDKLVPLRESASSSSSRLSLDSMTDDGSAPMYVALTTANQLVSGEAMAAASATALVLSASSAPMPAPSTSPPTSPAPLLPPATVDQEPAATADAQDNSPHSPNRCSSPNDEMKIAMLALSKMKDDLELHNRALSGRVSELQEEVKHLQEELNRSKKELASEKEVQSSNKVALERENDLLREQLKKYVSIVQSQRKESSSASESSEMLTQSGSAGLGQPPQEQSAGNTAAEKPLFAVDKKLQDMAEMYADLMELNERLHRTVADKDGTICALVRSLKEACIEIPLPEDQLPAAATSEDKVRLVEVWIPSAIKKGRGPDVFHVYQVFVSVKGVEWNVYRRYTEFREFHRQLQKHLPEVAAFNFPPKKAINNKTSQFVEERRQRLQDYLRFVIKCCSSRTSKAGGKNRAESILSHNTTKETLVTIFPFFKEDFNQEPNPAPQPLSYSGL